jgi:arabinofuranan 3-O-arabinosyltransferase
VICGLVVPFLPQPGLFFTKTLPFLLHGQDGYTRLSDSSLPTMLPRLGLEGWPATALRILVLLLAITAAVLRWRRGGDDRLRLVETSSILMIGAFLFSTPTFGFYPLVIVPSLVASVVVPGSVARSVWYWIASIPLLLPVKFYRLDFATHHVVSQMQAYKPFVWLVAVGALLLTKVWPLGTAASPAPAAVPVAIPRPRSETISS